MVRHAIRRKAAFDKKVLQRAPGEVIFRPGQLVQVYRNDLDYMFKVERKFIPKWSIPRRVQSRILNSYKLITLEGNPLPGEFSARHLRLFTPHEAPNSQQTNENTRENSRATQVRKTRQMKT
jgi:hypothetical protein